MATAPRSHRRRGGSRPDGTERSGYSHTPAHVASHGVWQPSLPEAWAARFHPVARPILVPGARDREGASTHTRTPDLAIEPGSLPRDLAHPTARSSSRFSRRGVERRSNDVAAMIGTLPHRVDWPGALTARPNHWLRVRRRMAPGASGCSLCSPAGMVRSRSRLGARRRVGAWRRPGKGVAARVTARGTQCDRAALSFTSTVGSGVGRSRRRPGYGARSLSAVARCGRDRPDNLDRSRVGEVTGRSGKGNERPAPHWRRALTCVTQR